MQRFYKQINGVNIIHYNPTPLEQIQSRIQALQAMETKERLQKELYSNEPKTHKTEKQVLDQLREILNITERTALQERIEATGCDY